MAGSPILDASGTPFAATPTQSPVRFNDGITEAIQYADGPLSRFGSAMTHMFGPQLAYAAYCASGIMQRVIELPANDRVREWRDWQADQDQIELLEAEEKRLGLIAKVRAAEILRGIGGGALILVAGGDPDQPINVTSKGGLVAINVVHKDQITPVDFDEELSSPNYGKPAMFEIGKDRTKLHPSRVVVFAGDYIPIGYNVSMEQAFWGQSRLVRLWKSVERSDNAQAWFAALIRKAKLLRIGIPNLTADISKTGGQERMNRRMSAIALSESVLNGTLYDTGDGTAPGEKIDDYQVSWNGIPAMMDAFDQRIAAVSGIPFTVLQGRSPGGLNATGDHDRQNWNREVQQGQNLELGPCLDQIDAALIPSALGSRPLEVWFKFAPLSIPTEVEQATVFKTRMEAVTALRATEAIPDEAFAKGVQGLMIEEGYLPGLDAALDEIPDDERYGLNPDDDGTNPSSLQTSEGGDQNLAGGGGVRRAANDAAPRTLYVSRKVQNVAAIKAWAKSQGLPDLQDDLHVTIAYSTAPVDWIKMGDEGWNGDAKGNITVKPGGPRVVEPLGDRGAVLMFAESSLTWRNMSMRENGASWDFPDYQPHISLTGETVDLTGVDPYRGEIVLGPEIFEEIRA